MCAKVNGEPVYEIHRPIAAHQELVVYYMAERPEELLFVHMRSTLYRRTMDSILEGKQKQKRHHPTQYKQSVYETENHIPLNHGVSVVIGH